MLFTGFYLNPLPENLTGEFKMKKTEPVVTEDYPVCPNCFADLAESEAFVNDKLRSGEEPITTCPYCRTVIYMSYSIMWETKIHKRKD